jgi:small subunit ribosomal protein S20
VANIKSQKKRIITNAKANDRNKAVRSELRSRVKAANETAGTAARRKSRLMRKLNATAAAAK